MTFAMILAQEPHIERQHCCDEMTWQANITHAQAESALLGSTDKRIYWSSVFNEYGLICQPSAEVLTIAHCPFCAATLPASHRYEWFKTLEDTGWRSWGDPIPEHMLRSDWRESNPTFQRTASPPLN